MIVISRFKLLQINVHGYMMSEPSGFYFFLSFILSTTSHVNVIVLYM